MVYGEQLWMNNYDGTFKDVFDFQETVSKQIAEALRLKLTPQEEKAIEEKPTQNAEAYELYLKGLEYHRLLTRDGYEKALKFYEEAVAIDPKYADAYLLIANVAAAYHRECSRDPKWLRRAEENLKIAENITGETAKTLWIHGEIEWQKGDFEEAEKALLRGAELDPKYGPTFNMLGNIYLKLERYSDAIEAFENSLDLTESNGTYFNLLLALTHNNDIDKLIRFANRAIPVMERYLKWCKDDLNAHVNYAFTLFWANRITESLNYAEELCQKYEMNGMALYNLSILFEKLGNPRKSIFLLEQSVEKGFREIETVRVQKSDDVEFQKKLVQVIDRLESIILEEGKQLPE